MKQLVFALTFLMVSSAFANNWYDRGNGGVTLQCDGHHLQVLDLYESSTRFNLPIVFAQADDEFAKATKLIDRLASMDPSRAALYQSWLQSFKSESQFVSGTFAKTPDLGLVVIPDGCTVEQAVVQQQPSVVNAFRYLINQKLWNELDADNKAALIVHELIYREFITTPTQEFSSERIRYFNAFINAGLPGMNSLSAYLDRLQELHIGTYAYGGVSLLLGSVQNSGDWKKADLEIDNSQILSAEVSGYQTIVTSGFSYFCSDKDVTSSLGTVTFANGKITSLNVQPDFNTSVCALPFFLYLDNQITGTGWSFDKNGQVTQIRGASSPQEQIVNYKGLSFVKSRSLLPAPSQATVYRFDGKMNLLEIGLGGEPCRKPNDRNIYFFASSAKMPSTVQISAEGKVTSKIPACY